MYKVYKLVKDGNVVYVGVTKLELRRRKSVGYRNNTNGLHSIRHECEIILIEETDDVSRERYWIDFYKDQPLLNCIAGLAGANQKELHTQYMRQYYKDNKEAYEKRWKSDTKRRERSKLYMRRKRAEAKNNSKQCHL
jgi:hypothetical protein